MHVVYVASESYKATAGWNNSRWPFAPIRSMQRRFFSVFSSFSCSSIAAKCCWLWHLMKVPKVKCKKKDSGNYFDGIFLLCCVYLQLHKHGMISVCIQGCFLSFICSLSCYFSIPLSPFPFLFSNRRILFNFFFFFLSHSFWSRTSKRHPRLGDIKARRFTVLLAAVGFHINLGRRYTLHCLRLLITGLASKNSSLSYLLTWPVIKDQT